MPRTRRNWLWFTVPALLLLLALSVALFWLWGAFDAGSYQEPLLRQLSTWLGRPVRFEDVEVGLLPPRLRLLGVRLDEAPGAAPAPLFTAGLLDADFNVGAVFGSEAAIRRLHVESPTLYLRQDHSGKWNLSLPVHAEPAPAVPQERRPAPLPISELSLENGAVVIERDGQAAAQLVDLEASIKDLHAGAPLPFRLRFRTGEAGQVEVEGKLSLATAGAGESFGLTTRVVLDSVASEQVKAIVGFPALPASTASVTGSLEWSLEEATSGLSGSLELKMRDGASLDPLSGWKAEGSARFQGLTCRLAENASPIRIGSARADFRPGHLEATLERVGLGSAEFAFQGQLDNDREPRLEFSLSGSRINLAALKSYFARSPATAGQPGRGYPIALRTARGSGDLDLGRLREGDPGLGPFKSAIRLENGTVRLQPLQMGLYGGSAAGSLVLNFARDSVGVESNLELMSVDLNALLSAQSEHTDRVFGRLSGSLQAKSTTSGPGLVASSQGEARIAVTEGRLAAVSLSRELSLLTEAIGLRIKREDTPIERMTASIQIGDGWVRTRDLIVDSLDFQLTGQGGFSFDQTLRLDAVAAISPDVVSVERPMGWVDKLTGAWPTDDEGRTLLPVQVRGTFSDPRYQLDAARLAELKLRRGLSGLSDIFKRPPG